MSTKNFNCGAYLAPIVLMLHQRYLGTSSYDILICLSSNSTLTFGRGSSFFPRNVALWHKADVQPLAVLGPFTGALPTFGAECRFTVAFQTQRQTVPKVF